MSQPNKVRGLRMAKEILDLSKSPPHGITCWPVNDSNCSLEAIIHVSDSDSPFVNGSFRISVEIPERYPMDPPLLKFLTKVYHPNIDSNTGLICLDLLKMPPQGKWRPINNLSSILTAVQQLLSDPNPYDPLDAEIAQIYISNKSLFVENAKRWTQLYAIETSALKRKCQEDNQQALKRPRTSVTEIGVGEN